MEQAMKQVKVSPRVDATSTSKDEELIRKALEREGIVLSESTKKNPMLFFNLLEFARRNEHCTFRCPGADACDSLTKGYTAVIDANGNLSYQKCAKMNRYWDVFKTQEIIDNSQIPAAYKTMTFANYRRHERNEKAVTYAKQVASGIEKQGMFLTGFTGTGKTHLAIAVLQEWMQNGHTGAFYTVPELMLQLRRLIDENKAEAEYIDRLTAVEMLVLDDLGAEKDSEWVLERLFMIINNRYIHGRITVITSNLMLEELEQRGGLQWRRICSRIAGMSRSFRLLGEDMRLW